MNNKKEQLDLEMMMKDLLNHPADDLNYLNDGIINNMKFTESEMADLKSAFNTLLGDGNLSDNKKLDLVQNSWKVNFKAKPPTMDEFLTNEYIGVTADGLYDYIRSDLISLFDPTNNYKGVAMYPHIRYGKTFMLILSLMFIATHYYYMRDPHKYLGVNKASYNCIALIAFNLAKAHELMIAPALNIMGTSEKFYRCRNEEQLVKKMEEFGTDKICYSTAVTGSAFRIGSLPFRQISSTSNLLGLALLGAGISELNFFQSRGWKQEDILDLFNTVVGRITASFPNNYYAKWILDSSPFDSTNLIEQYVLNDAPNDPDVMVRQGSIWTFQPWKSPIYEKDPSQTFPVFTGTESELPKIIEGGEDSLEYMKYDADKIIDVPIDYKKIFKGDLQKSLRDYAGIPSSAPDSLVNKSHIEPLFSPALKNIYTYIHAPANLPPEKLIWEKIKDQFFYKTANGKYEFYRNATAPRYVSVDQSVVNDWTGIAISHCELNKQGELVFVTDLALTIVPTKEKINLEAIKFFIRDLRRYGSMNIQKVGFDQFQSASTIQYLERVGFDVIKQSVDISTEPYLNYLGLMSRNCVKMGRSLVMKNNLKSLVMSKTKEGKRAKVDHTNGDITSDLSNTDWEKSKIGFNMKDLSDAVVSSVYLCDTYGTKNPQFIWEDVKSEEDNLKRKQEKVSNTILDKYRLKRRED